MGHGGAAQVRGGDCPPFAWRGVLPSHEQTRLTLLASPPHPARCGLRLPRRLIEEGVRYQQAQPAAGSGRTRPSLLERVQSPYLAEAL
jgi:hypothetical protein